MEEMLLLWAKSNGETIKEHTQNLLDDFQEFKKFYGKYFNDKTLKSIEYACKYHDYGKSMYIFQNKRGNADYLNTLSKNIKDTLNDLYKEIDYPNMIPHGYISPVFLPNENIIEELGEDYLYSIATAIYYHHNRKESLSSNDAFRIIEEDILKRYSINEDTLFWDYEDYILDGTMNLSKWIDFAIIMGMLNRFDYHASDTNPNKPPIEIDGSIDGKYINDFVLDYFKEKPYHINKCQQYAKNHVDDNIIMIASTGIGKTEASLFWANGEKVFYTLPLKVSINAMYERLIKERRNKDNKIVGYGYPKDKVTLLHSNALNELLNSNDNENSLTKYDASRRFSYPVTVCTIDQLFTFVYKYHGCEQFLSVLKYSKIIIDEIQSYEPKILAKLIWGLKIITQMGGKFAIVTATMPPVLLYFINRLNIPHEEPQKFLIDYNRHRIEIIKNPPNNDFYYPQIAKLSKDKKVLVICNTVKRACEVYSELSELSENSVYLLHSKYIQQDRKLLEDAILKFAKDETSAGIWVSTQIVEASLDIDFDILFTEMSTADSLLQRMGRCHRNRGHGYISDTPNVYILDNRSGYGTVYNSDIYNRSIEFLKSYDNNYFSESDKMDYINKVYNVDEIKDTKYFENLEKSLKDIQNIVPFNYTKNEALDEFRDIYAITVVPQSIYDNNQLEFEKAIKTLTKDKKTTREERANARAFIEQHSLSLSFFDRKRIKDCTKSLFNGLDYYTLNYYYEFNKDTLSGMGLSYYIDENSNQIW